MIGATVVVSVWKKPVINAVLLPAHAQTSTSSTLFVQASSLDADNPFARFVLIVDSADQVLANCGQSGGTATANDLPSGVYRVFADSNGMQSQLITVSTPTQSLNIRVDTDADSCNFLVATVTLPQGSISAASGEKISGSWDCSTNLDTMCP